ncbi:type II toxin-antitoxin system PemK/MazF family toxin [Roseospira navarrensis]|uniref:Type II toxin-antitoxin system PemK/MazF family toxin n=1 Tax=Roseospira navarrensis TaxID=140058 RepID=A0A7X1ZFV9_9PROT|nr:type II toxin-antitoxin system PemK/MazF family toxin [Roseospira navarrensis]
MIFDPFDVVVVPFPFSDRAASKRRPALVLSSHAFNAAHDQVVLAMITSSRADPWPSDVPLADWRSAGLTVPCHMRAKVFTLDTALILRRVGHLSDGDIEAVRVTLRTVFDRA